MSSGIIRIVREHPAVASLSTRIGRPLIGRKRATPNYLAGYNAALRAACIEGEQLQQQSEPTGFVTDFVEGWRTGIMLAQALGWKR